MKKQNGNGSSSGKYHEDADILKRVEAFFDSIHHIKGEYAGQSLTPQAWQWEKILRPMFGQVDKKTGLRRYRTVYLEIPRKQGKTTLGAGTGLYLTFCDRERGAEVYSAATDRFQASICFDIARQMAEGSEMLAERAQVMRRAIIDQSTASAYHVLSADAESKHGLNAHGVIYDELHAAPNRELWDVLKTSMGARRQPLIFITTTSGYDRQSICWEIHSYAVKVAAGLIPDDSFLPVLYGADPETDWKDPQVWKAALENHKPCEEGKEYEAAEEWAKTQYWTFPSIWAKANPNLGVSVKREYLEQECKVAQETPAYENTFKRLYLNIWTQQDVRWMPMEKWDSCNQQPVALDDMKGRTCYAGLDLASTTDLASLVLLFPPEDEGELWHVLPYFWVPEENVAMRAKRDKVDYATWIKSGLIIPTEGNVIDQEAIRMAITGPKLSAEDVPARVEERRQRLVEWHLPPEGLANVVQIKEIAIDRWNSTQLQTQLLGDGHLVVQFGQGFASMSAPTKELMGLVLSKKLNHGSHAVLRWNASNAAVKQDAAGNAKLDKEKSTEKIDGMVSLVMALGRASLQAVNPGSVYNDPTARPGGLLSVGESVAAPVPASSQERRAEEPYRAREFDMFADEDD
jgi:phage terminase large subunit-like protein